MASENKSNGESAVIKVLGYGAQASVQRNRSLPLAILGLVRPMGQRWCGSLSIVILKYNGKIDYLQQKDRYRRYRKG